MKRVRVRRDHPYAPAWTLVMLLVALTMYLITEGVSAPGQQAALAPVEQVSWDIQPLSISLVILSRAADEPTARIEAARYVARGAAGYILSGSGEYLVAGAGYNSVDEAGRVMNKLSETERLAASVATREAPEIAVRLTGRRAQADALIGAERALRDETSALGEAAFRLDAGEIDLNGAREVLLSARAEAKRAREALERATAGEPSQASEEIAALLSSFEDASTTMLMSAGTSPLFFSSQMKYNYIDIRLRHIGFLARLAGDG
jgi:hypothetical protein